MADKVWCLSKIYDIVEPPVTHGTLKPPSESDKLLIKAHPYLFILIPLFLTLLLSKGKDNVIFPLIDKDLVHHVVEPGFSVGLTCSAVATCAAEKTSQEVTDVKRLVVKGVSFALQEVAY